MSTYYRTTDGSFHELSAEQFAALQTNGKADTLRLYVVDVKPTPSATQVVVDSGIVVGPVEAHQTWSLREKTADELEDDALSAELLQVDTLLANIDTQNAITNAAFNAMTTAQKFDVLRADRNHLLRAAKFLLRRAKRGM
jgi:Tfp pilus assembly protein PilW